MKGTYKVPKATLPRHLEERKVFRFLEYELFCLLLEFHKRNDVKRNLTDTKDQRINLENIEVQWQCWQCFCSALMVKYQFTPAMSIIYLAYISYNLSYNLSIEPLSSIRVMHPTIYPNINFSTWRQGFCVSLWSVGEQRAARLEKIIPLFRSQIVT